MAASFVEEGEGARIEQAQRIRHEKIEKLEEELLEEWLEQRVVIDAHPQRLCAGEAGVSGSAGAGITGQEPPHRAGLKPSLSA
ncbi:MAG: hypothetical protein N2378_16720 [Chloroflexaceae bacterium]|nr:hypothetical protein [Chloroflexaceae bacterium]